MTGEKNRDTTGGLPRVEDFKVGARVESTGGDDVGEQGTVVAVVPGSGMPIHWEPDGGGLVRCSLDRVGLVKLTDAEHTAICQVWKTVAWAISDAGVKAMTHHVPATPEAFPCEHCHPEEIPGVRGAMARGETRIARATADAKADAEKRSLDALHDSIYRREGDPAPRPASEKAEAEVARLRSALEEAAAALHCGSCAEDAHNCPDHGNVHAKIDTALATASAQTEHVTVGHCIVCCTGCQGPGAAGNPYVDQGDQTSEYAWRVGYEAGRRSASALPRREWKREPYDVNQSDASRAVTYLKNIGMPGTSGELLQCAAYLCESVLAPIRAHERATGSASAEDWTKAEDGGVNSSPLFLHIAERIETMLRETRPDMIPATARLIVAQLAHVHGLAPRSTPCAGLEQTSGGNGATGLEPEALPSSTTTPARGPEEAGTFPDCGCTDGTAPDEPSDRGFICPHDPAGDSSSPADVLAMFPVRAGECPQHGRFGPVCVGCVEARVRRETIEACAGHVRSSPSCSMEDIARRVEYLMASDTKRPDSEVK